MADPLCKFFDTRSITGSQFFATYSSAQKPFLLLPLVSLHNPSLVRTRRRRRTKSLHIAFCSTPTSSNLDVLSTHEHSDGSVLFRFGDPSEVAKEDELEETILGVEEVERDNEGKFSVVKVFDGDNESEVIVQEVDREAKGQAVSVASESVVTNSKSNDCVERETGLSENFLEDSKDYIASISSVGIQDESENEVKIENAEHVEEILERKDDSEASVPPPENSIPSLEVEEEVKGQSSDESFEELDDDRTPLLSSPASMSEYSDSVNTTEVEESELEDGSSQLIENGGDKECPDYSTHLMENGEISTVIEAADDDMEIVQQTEQISENIDPVMEEPVESAPGENNVGNTETVVDEISPENADIKHLSMDAEDQCTEVLNFENDDKTELSNLSVETENQAAQDSTLKDSAETNVIEAMSVSPELEAEPILVEEVDQNLISESNENESPLPPDGSLPSLSLEAEREEDVANSEIMEVSGHEVIEDKSSEVLGNSKEATPSAAELILFSGTTLLQYPSKALTGGHEAYFVASGKWLGVADGVGSWSLEGSDPGVYAQELMQNSEFIVSQCDEDLINDPKQVLNLSVTATDSPGSSTVLIARFDGKALHVANIGDSGFIVLRNGSVYRKSSPMLHEFNLPIQIEKGIQDRVR
ncbi:probable protein phosphatase 2C 62 isoform X2 [Lycium barbarum]|uniref:probable protein phosphatase 2C 62 isoform X2 n=1 Tax=Lycium barbarum TaxID=112863 RepID=UPI00293E8F49|nr:probable protein phosphatase 2C 62 isoform X2 [Lycium barbarum]